MPTPPHVIDWGEYITGITRPGGGTVPYIGDLAPPARLGYLIGLAYLMRAAAFGPYASQAMTTAVSDANGSGWTFGQVYGPGVRAAQALAVRSGDLVTSGGAPAATTAAAPMSGTTAADVVTVPSAISSGIQDTFPPPLGGAVLSEGSRTYDATPAGAMDRMLEIAPAGLSSVESFEVNNCIGWSTRAELVSDLETI